MELLSGLSMGQRDEQGQYPDGSVNQRVDNRVSMLAEVRQSFHQTGGQACDHNDVNSDGHDNDVAEDGRSR